MIKKTFFKLNKFFKILKNKNYLKLILNYIFNIFLLTQILLKKF
jgi:hypothetical protein